MERYKSLFKEELEDLDFFDEFGENVTEELRSIAFGANDDYDEIVDDEGPGVASSEAEDFIDEAIDRLMKRHKIKDRNFKKQAWEYVSEFLDF